MIARRVRLKIVKTELKSFPRQFNDKDVRTHTVKLRLFANHELKQVEMPAKKSQFDAFL